MRYLVVCLLVSCATVSTSEPLTESDNCRALIAAFCIKAETCGFGPAGECFRDQSPGCNTVSGITTDEASACASELSDAPCHAPSVPKACSGIATDSATSTGIEL